MSQYEIVQGLDVDDFSRARIDATEATRIRKEWQRLQGRGEAFVFACEQGYFDPDR